MLSSALMFIGISLLGYDSTVSEGDKLYSVSDTPTVKFICDAEKCGFKEGTFAKLLYWDGYNTYYIKGDSCECWISDRCIGISDGLRLFQKKWNAKKRASDSVTAYNRRVSDSISAYNQKIQDSLSFVNLKSTYPVLYIHSVGITSINSSGGIAIGTCVMNTSKQIIKYIDITVQTFNPVGDPVICDITKSSQHKLRITGPIYPLTEITGDIGSNCSYFEFENVAYNSTASCIRLIGVKVTFKGNVVVAFNSSKVPSIIDKQTKNDCSFE